MSLPECSVNLGRDDTTCQSIHGREIDAAVGTLLLDTVAPVAA